MSFLTSLWVRFWAKPCVLPDQVTQLLRQPDRDLCFILPTDAALDHEVIHQLFQGSEWQALLTQRQITNPAWRVINLHSWTGFAGGRLNIRPSGVLRQLLASWMGSIGADIPQRDIELIPVSVFWGRAPGRTDSVWRYLLLDRWAESWSTNSGLHRAIAAMLHGRNLLIQFGDPLSLSDLIGRERDLWLATRLVAKKCRGQFHRHRVAVIGPELASKRRVELTVLRTQTVRQAIRSEMRSKGISRHQAIQAAKENLKEIAADYSGIFVSLLAIVFRRVWNRLYDGVELHHLDKLQAVIDDHEIIYVPCHRSHLDYLLLSYVIYTNGYVVPHIAAGVNLNIPVIGRLLRKGGAFFIRRSFAGSPLYTAVFSRYLALMMARGHSLEYFIEGGRSRTGRLLTPKTGVLTMTVRSYLREPKRPVVFVPVYFGYERIAEGPEYLKELSGVPKQRETFLGLLKALPLLRQQFGKVNVSIGSPIHLDSLLDQYKPTWRNQQIAERPAWLGALVDDLALRIMRHINDTAHVGPINLLALVLLTTPNHALKHSELSRQLMLYVSLLRSLPYSPLVTITTLSAQEMIAYAERMKWIRRDSTEADNLIYVMEDQVAQLNYFRNNVLHLLVLPSSIAGCFQNNSKIRMDDIRRLAWRVYPYLSKEFFLHWDEAAVPGLVELIVNALAEQGLLHTNDGGNSWFRFDGESVEYKQLLLLGQITMPIIERYYMAVSLLLKAGSGRINQEVLIKQCHEAVKQKLQITPMSSPEFFDHGLFKSFLDLLRHRSVLGVNAEGRLTYTDMLVAVADDAEFVLHEEMRKSVYQVVQQ